MTKAFYYKVYVRLIRKVSEGQIDFIRETKDFINDNPIIAREQAFNFYNSYIDVLLQSVRKVDTSDMEARSNLQPFYKKDEHVGYIGIAMVLDKDTDFEYLPKSRGPEPDEFEIHCIPSNDVGSLDEIVYNLTCEYEYYEYFQYDTKSYKTEIQFFGVLDQHYDLNPTLESYIILKTPFDWTRYEEQRPIQYEFEKHFYWSGFRENIVKNSKHNLLDTLPNKVYSPEFVLDLIKQGEGKQIEFKRTLKYDIRAEAPGKETRGRIAKAICAFLNARGGFLLIGVTDDKEVTGLEYDYRLAGDKDPRDFLKLEFDNLIRDFFTPQTLHYIDSNVIQIENKDVFIVNVYHSKNPSFIKGQFGKEFFVRSEASSRQIHDIEDIVRYCFEHFTNI